MKKLELHAEDVAKCIKCGTCRSVCPTFKVVGREPSSARGRLTLVDAYIRGEVGPTEAYIRHIKDCTLCGACKSNCPNGVDTPGIITAARVDLVEKLGKGSMASVVLKNLDSGKLMPMALKLASRLQNVFFRDSGDEGGLLSRFPLPVVGGGRLIPPLAKTFYMDTPEARSLKGMRKGAPGARKSKTRAVRVAFYVGCGINYLMPDVGRATVDVLKRAGADVFVPEGQVCCGMPAYATGDVKTARGLALKNLEEFESYDVDFIVTSCATCGHGLKNVFRELLSDQSEDVRKRAEAVSAKVRDISELLLGELGFTSKDVRPDGTPRVVTYHDPCHLGRYQGVREQPRDLVKLNKSVTLREMKNPCLCCGLGGGLSLSNYELSMEIARKKAENVKKSGADVVVTGCPGCMVQLRDGLHRYGVDAKVAHVVELL